MMEMGPLVPQCLPLDIFFLAHLLSYHWSWSIIFSSSSSSFLFIYFSNPDGIIKVSPAGHLLVFRDPLKPRATLLLSYKRAARADKDVGKSRAGIHFVLFDSGKRVLSCFIRTLNTLLTLPDRRGDNSARFIRLLAITPVKQRHFSITDARRHIPLVLVHVLFAWEGKVRWRPDHNQLEVWKHRVAPATRSPGKPEGDQTMTPGSVVGSKAKAAGVSSASYRFFDVVPQRGFFAPSKCAAPVIAFSDPAASAHTKPPASPIPPALRPAMESALLPAFSPEHPPKLIMGNAQLPGDAVQASSLENSMSSLLVPSKKGPRKKKASNGGSVCRATMTATAASKLLASTRGKTYCQDQENQLVDIAGCTASGTHSLLWTAAADGSIEVRSLADPTLLLNAITPATSDSSVTVTALLQIGQNKVVAGDSSGMVHVLDARSGERMEVKKAHSKAISCMSLVLMPTDSSDEDPSDLFYPRASVLLTGSLDGTIAKWDGVTLECLGRLTSGKKGVTAVAGCQNGCYAFSGCEAGTIRCWNLMDNSEVKLTSSERQALSDFKAGVADTCSQSAMSASMGFRHETMSNTSFQEASGILLPSPQRSSRAENTKSTGEKSRPGAILKSPKAPRSCGSVPRLRLPQESSVQRSRLSLSLASPGRGSVGSTYNTPMRAGRQAPASTPATPLGTRKTPGMGSRTPVKASGAAASVGRVRSTSVPILGVGKTPKKKANALKAVDCDALLTRLEGVVRDYLGKLPSLPLDDKSALSALVLTAEESSALNFEFPIQSIHSDQITGLEIIDDRFLVSSSRDMTASLFTLPSGTHHRTFRSEGRRGALSQVVYDRPTGRLLVFSCDGDLTAFNMRSGRMEAVLKLSTGLTTPGCAHFTIQSRALHRFLFLSTGSDEKGEMAHSSISSVAQIDRNISAPVKKKKKTKKTTDSIKTAVGEPSTEEVHAAISIPQLQKTCMQNRRMVESVRKMGTIDDMEIEDLRKCGVTFQRWHLRRFLLERFLKWQRWTEKRIGLPSLEKEADRMRQDQEKNLVQHYFAHWRSYHRSKSLDYWSMSSSALEGRAPWRGNGSHRTGELSIERNKRLQLILFLDRKIERNRAMRAFSIWVEFLRERQIFENRQVAYNRLLLSFSGKSLSTAALVLSSVKKKAIRASWQERALYLLDKRMECVEPQLSLRYFRKWRHFRDEASARNLQSGWKEAKTCRPRSLLLLYFLKWLGFAKHHVKEERLKREGAMLKREWLTLQNTMDSSRTVEDLQKEVLEHEGAIVRIAYDKEIQDKKRMEAEQEMSSLRIQQALRMFLNGFDPLEYNQVVPETRGDSPSISAASTPQKNRSHQRTRSWFKALGGIEETLEVDYSAPETLSSSEGSDLRRHVISILRALKGCALHLGRDYVKVSVAFESVSSLSIADGNLDASRRSTSTGSAPFRAGGRSRTSLQYRGAIGESFDPSAFSSVSDAFDNAVSELISLLYTAAREAGIDPTVDAQLLGASLSPSLGGRGISGGSPLSSPTTLPRSTYPPMSGDAPPIRLELTPRVRGERDTANVYHRRTVSTAAGVSINWLQFVSLRTRQEIMELVAHLLVLYDSFMVHNENVILDSRGAQSLPLSSLCSTHAASQLVRHASLLIELLHPQIWQRQFHLNSFKPLEGELDDLPNNDALDEALVIQDRPSSRPSTPRMRQQQQHNAALPSRAVRQAPSSPLSQELLRQVPKLFDDAPPLVGSSVASPSMRHGGWLGSSTTPRSSGLLSGAQSTTGSVPYHPTARSYIEDEDMRSMRSIGSTPRGSISGLQTGGGKAFQRPFLGFRVDKEAAASTRAIYIKEISPLYTTPSGGQAIGPAAAAGLQVGDQFVRFAGYAVTDLAAFNTIVTRHVRQGAELPVVVRRNKETFTTVIRVAILLDLDAALTSAPLHRPLETMLLSLPYSSVSSACGCSVRLSRQWLQLCLIILSHSISHISVRLDLCLPSMAPTKKGSAAQGTPAAQPSKSTEKADGEGQQRRPRAHDGPDRGPKGPKEHKERPAHQQKAHDAHAKAPETGPFARVSENVQTSTIAAGNRATFADIVRHQAGRAEPPKPKEASKPTEHEKTPVKAETVKPEQRKSEPVKEVVTETPKKSAPPTPAAPPVPVEPVVVAPKKEAPPPPPKPEPQAIKYHVLEIDRVETLKFPPGFFDSVPRDQTFTFSGIPGNPPPPPPAATPNLPAPTPAAPPPHQVYHQELLQQQQRRPNPVAFHSFGPPANFPWTQSQEWGVDHRFNPGMQYSSHTPANPNLNRPQGYVRVPRDFTDPRTSDNMTLLIFIIFFPDSSFYMFFDKKMSKTVKHC
eukprot:gene4145-2987_t